MNIEKIILPKLFEITAVNPKETFTDIENACIFAAKEGCRALTVSPSYLNYISKKLSAYENIIKITQICVYGGADLTSVKIYSAKQAELLGAQRIETNVNISAFKSGDIKYILHEIQMLKTNINIPITLVIEPAFLSDEEITTLIDIALKNIDFIKFGSGFFNTELNIDVLKKACSTINGRIPIIYYGNFKTLKEINELSKIGVNYFAMTEKIANSLLSN